MVPSEGHPLIRCSEVWNWPAHWFSRVILLIGTTLKWISHSMLTPIKVADKLLNLPIIALTAHFKYHGSFDHEHSLPLLITKAGFNYINETERSNENGKNNFKIKCSFWMCICMFCIMAFFHVLFLITYMVTTNAYKVTARIVLILSHLNWERKKLFITLFYSISVVFGPKRLVTVRVSGKFKDKYFISS